MRSHSSPRMTTGRWLCLLAVSVVAWAGSGRIRAAQLVAPVATVDLSSNGSLPLACFGSAVTVDNVTALVAGLRPGAFLGLVQEFDFDGTSWNAGARLDQLPNVLDTTGFGAAVAISGNMAVVLARPSTSTTRGIYVFGRDASGTWSLQKLFTSDDWPIANVTSVALSGNTLMFGNPVAAPPGSKVACGVVDVFVGVGGFWTHLQTLRPADPVRSQHFGAALALDGDSIAIGSPNASVVKNANQGACYVFHRVANAWKETAKVIDPAGAASHLFGTTVALSGSRLLAGSPGKTYSTAKGSVAAFHQDTHGIWRSEGPLPGPLPDPDPSVLAAPLVFGNRIALSGSIAVVGNSTTLISTDRSYVYQRRGNSWVQLAPFGADPAALAPSKFPVQSSVGGVVGISGSNIVVGSPNETSAAGVRSGVARFYSNVDNFAIFDGPTLDAPELVPANLGDTITVDLGDLVLGRTITRTFTLQNLGSDSITDVLCTADNPDVVTPPDPVVSLDPNASMTVTLVITPSTDGDWQTQIVGCSLDGTGPPAVALELVGVVIDVPSPPFIVVEPEPAELRYQGSCLLSVRAFGTEPLSYQWFHDGRAIPGAASRTLALNGVTLGDAGSYTVTVSNDSGRDFSTSAAISVYQMVPATSQRFNEGDSFVLDAPVAGPGLQVQWQLNGASLSDNAVYSGTGTGTLAVSYASAATVGKFSVLVTAGSTPITAKTMNVTVLLRPVIQSDVTALASLPVTSAVSFQFVTSPASTRFVFAGVPPGIVANTKTGILTGTPGSPGRFTLRVAGVNAAGTGPQLAIPVTVTPVAASAVGTFQGIIGRNVANGNLGGQAVLSVTASGRCTGYATAGASTVRFNTSVGMQPGGTAYQVNVSSTSSSETQLFVFNLDPGTGRLTGQFVSTTSQGAGSSITGWRNPWSAVNPAIAWTDYLTCSLTNSPAITRPLTIPQGVSYGTVAVSSGGAVTWAGRMADGSVTTQSSVISPAQPAVGGVNHVEVPLHFLVNAGTGSAQGLLLISQSNPASSSFHGVSGSFDWLKMPGAGRLYAAGIDLHSLAVAGSPYAPPAGGSVVLGLPAAGSNAVLSFGGAGIESVSDFVLLGGAFTITSRSQALFDVGDPLSDKLTINPATGTFSGSLALQDPNPANPSLDVVRSVSYSGILLSRLGQGIGFFSLPALPNSKATPPTTLSTSPIQTGTVVLRVPN